MKRSPPLGPSLCGRRRLSLAFGCGWLALAGPATAGPAATPPMGWNPWNAFRTEVDEAKIMANADMLVASGLAGAGYRQVNIDDGWWLRRDAGGRLQIRTALFPSARGSGHGPEDGTSFRPFTDALHARGLKAGIYTDIGRNNCAQHWDRDSPNLPEGTVAEREVGTLGFQEADARLFFADWGFDYVKVDACGLADFGPAFAGVRDGSYRNLSPLIDRKRPEGSEPAIVEALYAGFAGHMRRIAPDAVLAICAWGEAQVADWAGRHGQLWRTSPDIRATWGSMLANFDSAAPRALFAGPGRWNDPDMLEIGNGDFDAAHLTEARAHMSLWAIIAAPLILSLDLTRASPELMAIIGNRQAIAIDQDAAGHQGVILDRTADSIILVKPLTGSGQKALALVNRSDRPLNLSVDPADLHLRRGVTVRDVWRDEDRSIAGPITVRLAPRETALLRVSGRPANPAMVHADEMPAAIAVIDAGRRPPGRRDWIGARIGYRPSGAPIIVAGRHDHDALGAAAGSRLRLTLAAGFHRFHARPSGGGTYTILADGQPLHRGVADGRTELHLAVSGVRTLELIAPVEPAEADGFAWTRLGLER